MTIREILNTIDKKEKRLVFGLIIVLVIVTAVPYLFGYLRTPAGTAYTGLHSLTPGDTNVYYSYIEQVKQGHYFYQDLYTSEKQNYTLINPFWLSVGIFAKILHLPNWLALQLSRLLLIPFFIWSAYLFIAYLFSEKNKRKIALIFTLFSSGLGAILSPLLESIRYISPGGEYYHWPMDLWVPESVSFLSLYHLPHILASSILFIIVFLLLFLAFENNKYIYSIAAGILLLAWLSFHPFHVFTVFLVFFVYLFLLAIRKKIIPHAQLKHFIIAMLIGLPAVIYHYYIIKIDPVAAGRAAENILLTPVPWLLLVSYGFTGIFAIFGIAAFLKKGEEKHYFLVVWLAVQTLLLYAPLVFQRRLSQNLHFPMVLLSTAGIYYILLFINKKITKKTANRIFNNKVLFAFLFIIVFAFSNIYAVVNDIFLYKNISFSYFYQPNGFISAMDWLKNNTTEKDVIISDDLNGNFIPGFSGRKVYLGHGVETVNALKKLDEVKWFFQNDLDEILKEKFLKERGITYLYYSENEKKLGSYNPDIKNYLRLVYKNTDAAIFSVISP